VRRLLNEIIRRASIDRLGLAQFAGPSPKHPDKSQIEQNCYGLNCCTQSEKNRITEIFYAGVFVLKK
jgi:hypothetical protein